MKSNFLTWIAVVVLAFFATVTLRAAGPIPTLPETGVNIARAAGGWLNVEATGNRLVVRLFDAAKNPAPVDGLYASARVVYPAREDRRVILNPDGDTLVSPASIKPPLVFRIHFTLFVTGSGEAESFVVRYPKA